ncbi:MAG: cytidine deaminase [Oscillospiraceae bacterium]|jgi:cytidine deaminase|nr:cytidine deaminase [Oscillospiraceae bacterium]
MDEKELVLEAMNARKMAYTPYSGFSVGAALLAKSGKIYRGCNIENAAYTPSNCAERTAFFKAVSEGEHEFKAIAIVGGKAGAPLSDYCPPCGVCRQVMMEFCSPDQFQVILAKSPEERKVLSLRELLPFGFGKNDLGKGESLHENV